MQKPGDRSRGENVAEQNLVSEPTSRRWVTWADEEFPRQLRQMLEPPTAIRVEGSLAALERMPCLAIVGTREISPPSEVWMRRELFRLKGPVLIVSGGARGVDALAHQIALERGWPTGVLMPSGLDRPYPEHWMRHRHLVLQGGGFLMSEFRDEQRMQKSHFAARNRLIASLADFVLLIEARFRSGSSITATHARENARELGALPWSPLDLCGELNNQLIVDGAHLIRSADDLSNLLESEYRRRRDSRDLSV
ncbi:MAG TPA: DNA-processing protein DprA [Pseudobdellovibrionaceae bacterium]|nr:DNA-processing protein DprA [Pseudobdellovibrionaceae bacterium]